VYKEIQMGSVAKSYMEKGFLVYEEMRKYLTIYEEADPIWISWWSKFYFRFLSVWMADMNTQTFANMWMM